MTTRPAGSRHARHAATIAGAAAALAVLTLATRAVGFGRWLVFSHTVGSSCVGSAYASANVVPNVLFEVVAGGALAASVVPVLSGALVRGDGAAADRAASAMLGWAVVVLTPVAVLVAALAHPIAALLLAGDACPGQVDSAARMLVAFAPQVVLYGAGIVLTGVLQAHRRFLGPAVAPLLSSLVVIGVYLLFGAATSRPSTGPAAAAWLPGRGAELLLGLGTTAGVLVLSLPLLVPAARAGVRLRPTLRFDPGVAGRVRRLAAAGLAGLVAQQLLLVVTVRLANAHGGAGAVNVYTYVQAVYLLPYAVLAVPLATAAFPGLSAQAAAGDGAGYARTLGRSTRLVLLVSAAGAALLVAAAPAVGAAFTALDVGRSGLRAMPWALTAFAPGLPGFALVAHLGRALFAAGQVSWAARSTVAGWLVAVLGSVVAVPVVGDDPQSTLVALGLASSLGMTVAGAGLWVGAGRVRIGADAAAGELRRARPVLAGALVLCAAAACTGRGVADLTGAPGLPRMLVSGVAGAVVAAGVVTIGLALFDREDLRALVRRRVSG